MLRPDPVTLVLTILSGILILLVVFIYAKEFYEFIVKHSLTEIIGYKLLYGSTMIAILSWMFTCIACFAQIMKKLLDGYPNPNSNSRNIELIYVITFTLYYLSLLLTLGIYIIRIHLTFVGTALEYKHKTLKILKVLWISMLLYLIIAQTLMGMNVGNAITRYTKILSILLLIGVIIFMCTLFYMIMVRLKQIAGMDDDPELKNVVVKLTNLYTLNIVSSALTLIGINIAYATTANGFNYSVIVADLLFNLDASYVYMYIYI